MVDVQFTAGKLPALQEALTVTARGTGRTMGSDTACQRDHCALHHVRQRGSLGKGMTVTATGHGLTAPVGEATLGRMFDPLGRPSTARALWMMCVYPPQAPSFAGKPATEIWKPASRSSTCWPPMQRAARSVCLAVQASTNYVLIQGTDP